MGSLHQTSGGSCRQEDLIHCWLCRRWCWGRWSVASCLLRSPRHNQAVERRSPALSSRYASSSCWKQPSLLAVRSSQNPSPRGTFLVASWLCSWNCISQTLAGFVASGVASASAQRGSESLLVSVSLSSLLPTLRATQWGPRPGILGGLNPEAAPPASRVHQTGLREHRSSGGSQGESREHLKVSVLEAPVVLVEVPHTAHGSLAVIIALLSCPASWPGPGGISGHPGHGGEAQGASKATVPGSDSAWPQRSGEDGSRRSGRTPRHPGPSRL